MSKIKQVLVIGKSMYSGHKAAGDAESIVYYLDHWHEAIGRARATRDDRMERWIKGMVVNAYHKGAIRIPRGSRDDYSFHASPKMSSCRLPLGEPSRGLHYYLGSNHIPRYRARVGLREHLDILLSNDHTISINLDGNVQLPIDGVVSKQMGIGSWRG